jgi:hypothetical protein
MGVGEEKYAFAPPQNLATALKLVRSYVVIDCIADIWTRRNHKVCGAKYFLFYDTKLKRIEANYVFLTSVWNQKR